MNDDQPVPNPLLRAAATQIAFHLTLTRNQIAVLEAIAHNRREPRQVQTQRADRLWVPICRNLGDKGLVEHRHMPNFVGDDSGWPKQINNYYRLTRAGWLMLDLLVEAGMAEAPSTRKRLVA